LGANFTARLAQEETRIREELGERMREEGGRWVGAVWPIAATILIPDLRGNQ